jgi:hypothetical protein
MASPALQETYSSTVLLTRCDPKKYSFELGPVVDVQDASK